MTDHDEAIDRLLDALADGKAPDEPKLDAQSITAATRLIAAGQGPQPDSAFRNRLESMLRDQAPATASSALPARNAGFGIALQPGLPRWRPRSMLATAAILALAMLSALSVVRLGDTPEGSNTTFGGVFQAASASAHSDESTCVNASQPTAIEIKLDGKPFALPETRVAAGVPISLSVANHGESACSVSIDGLNLSTSVAPEHEISLSLTLKSGTYVVRVDAPGDGTSAIAGVIRSIEAGPTATPAS